MKLENTNSKVEEQNNNSKIGYQIGSSVGGIVGLGYAFKVKSGFWKGWGYLILGGLVVGGLGYGIGMAIPKKKQ
jgi:hypothetical protein